MLYTRIGGYLVKVTRPSFGQWYCILRLHYHWGVWESFKYAWWLWR